MINGRSFSGYGNEEELAKREAIRSALSSFTPEDMGWSPIFRRAIQSVEEDTLTSVPAEINQLSNNVPSTIPPLSESAIRKRIEHFMRNRPRTLALMQPKADCVIIKKDYDEISHGFIYTARGNYNNSLCHAQLLKLIRLKFNSDCRWCQLRLYW